MLFLGFATRIFRVAEGPQALLEVLQVPLLPLYPPVFQVFHNLFSILFNSQPPDRDFFGSFWDFSRHCSTRGQCRPYPTLTLNLTLSLTLYHNPNLVQTQIIT